MEKSKLHIPIVDGLRGIAAFAVCLFHFVVTTINFVNDETVLYVFNFGKLGVQLFFVISGFVIPWSLYNYRYKITNIFRFLIKRLARLEPPYLVSILLMVLIIVLRKYSPYYNGIDDTPTIARIILHLGYLIPFTDNYQWLNPVYWTLAIEFQYYIFIGVFYFVIVHTNQLVRFIGYGILFALHFTSNDNFLPYWLPLFALGLLSFLYLSQKINIYEFCIITLLFSVFIGIYINIETVIAGIIPVLSMIGIKNYSNRILKFLGDLSYSMYLTHPIVGAAVVNLLSHKAEGALQKTMVVLAGVITTILFSYLFYKVVELPSKKLSSKIKLGS